MAGVATEHDLILPEAAVEPLAIFVATPGTTFGEHAEWNNLEEIKKHLHEPECAAVGERLGREAVLIIERDRQTARPIHHTTFAKPARRPAISPERETRSGRQAGSRWTTRCHS
ncbi:hypothetical protein LFM09_17245 [Lentzea alba]|uniref:hypothetical protein n=1 Tax=Lentzea alba TaxID=2714351 RepID=UPI0039BEE059